MQNIFTLMSISFVLSIVDIIAIKSININEIKNNLKWNKFYFKIKKKEILD